MIFKLLVTTKQSADMIVEANSIEEAKTKGQLLLDNGTYYLDDNGGGDIDTVIEDVCEVKDNDYSPTSLEVNSDYLAEIEADN